MYHQITKSELIFLNQSFFYLSVFFPCELLMSNLFGAFLTFGAESLSQEPTLVVVDEVLLCSELLSPLFHVKQTKKTRKKKSLNISKKMFQNIFFKHSGQT